MISAAVFLAILAVSSAIRDDCYTDNRRFYHGQRYIRPGARCIEYRCEHGQMVMHKEACEVEGQCHDVGSLFEHRCTHYQCTKEDHGRYYFYRPVPYSSDCRDHQGRCHAQGSTFAAYLHGKFYDSCTCTFMGSTVRYHCRSLINPARTHSAHQVSSDVTASLSHKSVEK